MHFRYVFETTVFAIKLDSFLSKKARYHFEEVQICDDTGPKLEKPSKSVFYFMCSNNGNKIESVFF